MEESLVGFQILREGEALAAGGALVGRAGGLVAGIFFAGS